MKISVIVPVYRVEAFIERCARSVLEQDYPDKEIIFVDDCSPDRALEKLENVLTDYPQANVHILRHAVNRGLAAARKTGLDHATGEYMVNVDSDDYIDRRTLSLLAFEAEKTKADIVGMDCYFEWNSQRSIYRGEWNDDPKEYSRLLLSGRTLPGVCLHMISKSLYARAGVQPVERLDNGEDYVTTPRLCWFAQRVAHVSQPLYHYMQTNNLSFTHELSSKNIRQLIQVVNVLSDFFEDKPECIQALRAGQWLKKTDLFMRVKKTDYPLVNTMPAALPVEASSLNTPQRIAAQLIAKKWWNALWLFSRCYGGALELVQIAKGRRRKC